MNNSIVPGKPSGFFASSVFGLRRTHDHSGDETAMTDPRTCLSSQARVILAANVGVGGEGAKRGLEFQKINLDEAARSPPARVRARWRWVCCQAFPQPPGLPYSALSYTTDSLSLSSRLGKGSFRPVFRGSPLIPKNPAAPEIALKVMDFAPLVPKRAPHRRQT